MLAMPLIGFSLVVSILLLVVYLCSQQFPRSLIAVLSCGCLTLALVVIQAEHLLYFLGMGNPFDALHYRIALFVAPTLFLVFGRYVVLPDGPFTAWLLAAFAPCLLPVLLPFSVALPILLLVGAGYASWLGWFVYRARASRPQHRFEFFFSTIIFVSAAVVMVAGAFLPWLDVFWFFLIYSQCIGIAYLFVVFALAAIPSFVDDLFEEGRTRYATSTLVSVDVDATVDRLNRLMAETALYKDDELTLSVLAHELDLTTHQLSELLNRHLGGGYSQYIRRLRIEAAKAILAENPDQSVLSVAMEVGFRSQSTFYAAFREVTGLSPGDYRKSITPG